MKCQSCGKQKDHVSASKSTLIEGMSVIMCDTCRSKGYEPRHVIILAILGGWNESLAKKFVAEKRYYGDEIKAVEIV